MKKGEKMVKIIYGDVCDRCDKPINYSKRPDEPAEYYCNCGY